ncbi:MAG: CYTH domain-containing protein, partial [Gemmatimonadota bacterium]
VLDEIAEMTSLAGRRIRWSSGDRRLRDVYFYTAGSALEERGLALRLRQDADGWWITLKGEGRAAAGAVERLEVEREWSEQGLERILGELEARRVRPPSRPALGGKAEPVEVLGEAGFDVIQDRRSRRRRGRILATDGEGETVARLVLDTVEFRDRSGAAAVHRGVEIEAAPRAQEGLPGRLASELRDRFPEVLRPWRHPKLATGLALERMDPPTAGSGALLPEAYDLLEAELEGD